MKLQNLSLANEDLYLDLSETGEPRCISMLDDGMEADIISLSVLDKDTINDHDIVMYKAIFTSNGSIQQGRILYDETAECGKFIIA